MRKLIVTFCLLFSCHLVYGLQVKLSNNVINLSKGEKSQNITISNDKDSPVAIEVFVKKRSYSIDGIESYTEDTEDLVATVPQMILKAKQSKLVQIRWLNTEKTIDSERAYRIVVDNVPIKTSQLEGKLDDDIKAGAKIQINYRVARSFYVRNDKHQAKLVLNSAGIKNNELLLSFENKGSKHQIAYAMTVGFSQSGKKYKHEMTRDDLDGGINLLAGEKREVLVAWPKFLNVKLPLVDPKIISVRKDLK